MLILWLLGTAISSNLTLNCECSPEQLGDGNCDKECVTPQCNYDSPLKIGTTKEIFEAGDCYSKCTKSCGSNKLNDGFCDLSCTSQKCAFDLGDCGYCSLGCFQSWLGDGACDSLCDNYDCGYDSGDCGSCASGCFPDMLGNGTCDSKCDKERCNYDDGDCRSCSENCTQTMLNNDTCDEECFSLDCNFDNNSCGCSPDCTEDKLGTCSMKCMTYRCDFDKECVCDDCDDNFNRFQAIVHQILVQDLTSAYKFSDSCNSDSCTKDDLLDGYHNICHEDKCQSSGCLYQLGACNQEQCPEDCLRCADSQTCFECDPQSTKHKNRFGVCVSECEVQEVVYELCLKDEGCSEGEFYKLCVPDTDNSSVDNPHVLIVDPSDPGYYESIQSALNYAWKKHTKILIKEGYYSEPFSVSYFTVYKEMSITFEGDPQATIKLLNTQFQFPDYFAYIHIKNIVFDGSQSIDNSCEMDSCTYCPYISEIDGVYYDDRGKEIENSSLSNYGNCTGLSPLNLIDTSSPFFIENCEFRDIRYGSSNLIRVRDNDLHVLNTNFTNIFCNGTDNKGVINIMSENSNSLDLEGGTVRLINNGYEYIDGIEQFGFVAARELDSVIIKNVEFEFNALLSQNGVFIKIDDVFKTQIKASEFKNNIIMGSLIKIDNTSLKLKDININSDGFCEECSETNVNIEGNKFTFSQSTESLIEIEQESITNNVKISQNYFEQIITDAYIIDLYRLSMFSNADASGGEEELQTVDGETITAKIYRKNTEITNNNFEKCLCDDHMNIMKLPNINLDRNDLFSLRTTKNIDKIVQLYIDSPDTYMEILAFFKANLEYESIFVKAKNTENLNFTNSEFSDLECYSEPCILQLSEMTGDVLIMGINGSNSNKQIMEISAAEGIKTLTLKDINIIDIDLSSNLISISDFPTIIARNIHLENLTEAGLRIESGENVELYESSFHNISSTEGALQFRMKSTDSSSQLTISDVSVSNCYSEYTAGIYLDNQGNYNVQLDLKQSNFTNNYAFDKGSALHIRPGVTLGHRSKIRHCNFIDNEAELDGTVYIYIESGELNITSCSFDNNRANNFGSDLYIESLYDFTLTMNDINITNSKGTNNVYVKDRLQSISAYLNSLRFENISGGVVIDGVETFLASGLQLMNVSSDSSVFEIEMNGKNPQNILNVSNSSFKYGSSTAGSGLAVDSIEKDGLLLIIKDCDFQHNVAEEYGSSILVKSSVDLRASSLIESSLFAHNSAVTGGTVTMEHKSGGMNFKNCTFEENKTEMNGAAIYYRSFYADKISISDSEFRGNTGLNSVYISTFTGSNAVTTRRCVFEKNNGSPLFITQADWKDSNSEFISNESSSSSGAFVLENTSKGNINSSKFVNNTGQKGGAGAVQSYSELLIMDSVFESNTAENTGGALYIEKDSQVQIDNSTIARNRAFTGSAITLSSCTNSKTILNNTWIYENVAQDSRTIQADLSTLEIENIQFYSNIAYESTSGIYLAQSSMNVEKCNFYDQRSLLGSFIYSTGSSTVSIKSSSFKNGTSIESGGAIYSFLGNFEISDSSFDSMESANGAVFYLYFGVELVVKNSSFTNSKLGPVINLVDSNINIESSLIEEFEHSAIECTTGNLAVKDLTIQNGEGIFGGGIQCIDCKSLDIESSYFFNLKAIDGGAIYIESQGTTDIFRIKDSNFASNQAGNGGAIHAQKAMLSIEESTFESNVAVTPDFNSEIKEISEGRGGAIFLTEINDQAAIVSENRFLNNSATYNGGAIAWENSVEPSLISNTYEGNSAEYGVDYSSFPINLVQVTADGEIIQSRVLTDEPLESIASGQKIPHFAIAMVDHYGQIAKTDNVNTVSILGEDEVALSGTTKVVTKLGIANFTELVVSAPPDTNISISVSADSIQSGHSPSVSLELYSRLCEIGEVTMSNDCVVCTAETYSLDPTESQCRPCLENAKCYGRNEIVPLSGYWRSSNTSHVIWECPNSESCRGGLLDEFGEISYTGRCASGYFGNKCQSCDDSYSRMTANQCLECPEQEVNILLHVIVGILAIIVITIIVKVTMDSAYKEREEHSVYIKIFINYAQLVAMLSNFNLKWPDKVLTFFRIFIITSSAGTQYISHQCLFEEDAYYNELLMISTMPYFICLLSVIAWLFISMLKSEWAFMKYGIVSTIIIILFFMHPNLMTKMFSSMNCTEIEEGEYWLEDDMEIPCWESKHIFFILLISLPTIVIWGILVPALCLIYLHKQRHKLNKIEIKIRFGFIYNGYVNRAYFWEFVILYRKIIIICCAVFIKRISVIVQGLVVVAVFAGSLIAHVNVLPFRSRELNNMELRSLAAATITIYLGLFFLTEDLSFPLKIAVFCVICAVNGYFIFGWTVKMFGSLVKLLTQKVPFFRKFFHRKIHPTVEISRIEESERHALGIENEKYHSMQVAKPTDINLDHLRRSDMTTRDIFMETARQFIMASKRNRAVKKKLTSEDSEEEKIIVVKKTHPLSSYDSSVHDDIDYKKSGFP